MAVEVALALGDGLGESVDGELMAKDRRRRDQVWERGKGRALRTCPSWLDCGLHGLDNAGSQTGAEFGFVEDRLGLTASCRHDAPKVKADPRAGGEPVGLFAGCNPQRWSSTTWIRAEAIVETREQAWTERSKGGRMLDFGLLDG